MLDIEKILGNENEKPLDHWVTDGGFCGIFRTIGCVGDSLSSGEFEAMSDEGKKTYHDLFDYSWGQYLARMAGCKAYNFSRGGMTAKWYCETFADEKGFWDPEKACQAYIIALGVNDLFGLKMPLGSTEDIDLSDWHNNKPTFAGYYGQVIQRYKEIQPDAKFFLVTMLDEPERCEADIRNTAAHKELLEEMTRFFDNCYVIDLYTYGPRFDQHFRELFSLGWHLNPCGYQLTARMIASYMDYIIRHNMRDFREVGLVGTPYRYYRKKSADQ